MGDHFLVQNSITEVDIANQLKRIQNNLAAQNFIGNGEELTNDVVFYKRDIQPQIKTQKSQQPKRREIVKDNRVKMLEQVMNKTFTHGGITEIT